MIPSESAIDRAIDALSPGPFQQLAESYARVAFPGRFSELAVFGRNTASQTIAGWPDAYTVLPDGRLDAIEATRDARNWHQHLKDDIEHAEGLAAPGLGGLVFVAWAPTPRASTVEPERKRLLALGVSPEDVTFVFRADLVAALRSPAFAAVWWDLRLGSSPWPFVELSRAPIFGDGSAELFAPTRDEFLKGVVGTPPVASAVSQRLETDRWALVIGRGASGKTVMATALGLEWERTIGPSYYLDLAPSGGAFAPTNSTSAFDAIASRAASNVLFIVDNVHRDEDLAAAIRNYWEQVQAGSSLLLLGRQADSERAVLGIESPLVALRETALRLEVGSEEVQSVWRRLDARSGHLAANAAPPAGALNAWVTLFGGDLIAFGAALALRGTRPSAWSLGADDARIYVQTRYLAGLNAEQRAALVLVAEWSTLELAVPPQLSLAGKLDRAIADGIVERAADGFRTIHPGIAALIVAANGDLPYTNLVAHASRVPPEVAMRVARRLAGLGERNAAAEYLFGQADTAVHVIDLISAAGVTQVSALTTVVAELLGTAQVRSRASRADGLDAWMVKSPPDLVLEVLTAVRRLPGFPEALERAWVSLPPRTQTQVADALAAHANTVEQRKMPLVLRRIRQAVPAAQEPFLETFVEQGGLEVFFGVPRRMPHARWADLLKAASASDVFRERLLAILGGAEASPWPLLTVADATKMLQRIEAADPEIAEALIANIASERFQRAAVETALSSGPGPFLSRAKLAQQHAPALLDALVATCKGERWLDALRRWPRAYTKYPRLKAWAVKFAPELAKAMADGERALEELASEGGGRAAGREVPAPGAQAVNEDGGEPGTRRAAPDVAD